MKFYQIVLLFLVALFPLFGFNWQNDLKPLEPVTLEKKFQHIKLQSSNIDRNVLRLSLLAYEKAKSKGLSTKPYLTVIDYSKPSTEKRLWVFDLDHDKTLFNTWVSHGRNSGDIRATSFSNHQGSLKSCLGVFVTAETYMGGNGYSLRLRGLENGINDNAYSRSIVVHGAHYVNPDIIKRDGRIGRSWGCPAVNKNLSKSLIDTIKNKTVVFAYYPDHKWLTQSRFLKGSSISWISSAA